MATLNEKTTPKRTDNMLNELEKSLVEACQAGPLKSLDTTNKTVRVLSDIILRMNKELELIADDYQELEAGNFVLSKELEEKDIKIQALKEVLREDDIALKAPSISETFESDFGITR
jgi:hypothetical protein